MAYRAVLSLKQAEGRVASLFQPDTLLPEQYFATFRRKTHLEPEKRLMLAVLEDAVVCFQKHVLAQNRRGKAAFREAEDWILEQGSDWLFSFEDICEVLGLDPDYIRQALLSWKERRLAELSRPKIHRLNHRRKKKGRRNVSFKKIRPLYSMRSHANSGA